LYYDVTVDPATGNPTVYESDAKVKTNGGGFASFSADTIPSDGNVTDDDSGSSTQNPPNSGTDDDWGITPEQEEIAEKIAGGHAWDDHVDDPEGDLHGEFESKDDFADEIKDIIENPDDVKELDRGRKAWWDDVSGTVVIHDPNSPDGGTAFRPDKGKDYFNDLE